MPLPSAGASRRTPKQGRSRIIVSAIVEAGRRLLVAEGPTALTTNRIAERAGVSIGSLYRYFPDKQAIVAAIYAEETGHEVEGIRASATWPIEELPLHEALALVVDYQLGRHRRLLELDSDFYREHHQDFSLGARVGARELETRLRALLLRHRECVRVRDLDQAAFLIARGISAIVRRALDERPEKLVDPAFRDELLDLVLCYATGRSAGPAPA
jgi:AcrR family transcriptional regulator